jgi:abortive infection bacteriophage resistance protein
MREPYSKAALSFQEQLALLLERGLMVENPDYAEKFLSCVNYYRFSAYCIPFEKNRHEFKENASFANIVKLYEFDRKLRGLIYEALELIEIELRTGIAYEMAHLLGPFGHNEEKNFTNEFRFKEIRDTATKEVERSKEVFVEHFKEKYHEYPNLPVWAEVEIFSFGCLSTMFAGLIPSIQKKIARRFDLPGPVFKSWLHVLVYVRNLCAHHSRLWNRELQIWPQQPRNIDGFEYFQTSDKRVWAVILMINYFFSVGSVEDSIVKIWRERFESVIDDAHANIKGLEIKIGMGIPENWKATKFLKSC